MIQEVTHEVYEIRRNNTELYDSNRLKQGMGKQARYFTHEQLEDVVEETFQLPQCKAENEEDDLPITESDDDVSETVRRISSVDEEDSVFDFIRVFAYNSDGE